MLGKNRMRELFREGKPTLGIHLISCDPMFVEVVGETGVFDYVELVGEYASWGLRDLENFCRAAELHGLSTMFKIEEQVKGFAATRAIDAGFESVLFTDPRSVKAVKNCIALVRPETPKDRGVHGCGLRRIVHYGLAKSSSDEWLQAMREIVTVIMIEKRGAMEDLDKILRVPGVDMVQFGPGDYSITVGCPREEAKGTEQEMIKKAQLAGVPARVELANWEQAEPYLEMGVRHFCIGWDADIIRQYCLRDGTKMRELLKK